MHALELVNRPRSRIGWLGALGLLALGGCGSPPSLRLDSVDPGRVPSGASTQLHLQGDFEPSLSLDLNSQHQTKVVDEFQVVVGTHPATSVHLLARDTLVATLPLGLPVGLYDVRVTDPRGGFVVKAGGLEIY